MKKAMIILLTGILSIMACESSNKYRYRFGSQTTIDNYLDYLEDTSNYKNGSLIHNRQTMPNNESSLITHTMLGIGYYNLGYKNDKIQYKLGIERAIDSLLSDNVKQVSLDSWDYDPISEFVVDDQHGLYLGYLNIVLSLHQKLYGKSKYSSLNDTISDILYLKLETKDWTLPSYAIRDFFPDNMTIYASIGVNYKVRKKYKKLDQLKRKARLRYNREYRDLFSLHGPKYGTGSSYVVYSLYMMSYFVKKSFIHRQMKKIDRDIIKKELGYKGVTEYPYDKDRPLVEYDRDAGPIVANIGTTGTGYMLAIYKLTGYEGKFDQLFKTVKVFGGLKADENSYYFKHAGYPENAIMFGILTAQEIR